jgi:hypothetical protein
VTFEPVHQVVDASPAWVTRRLAALAKTMLLPSPVIDGFLFAADAAFYASCIESIGSLQLAVRRIIDHLGLSCDTVSVTFTELSHPGHIERYGRDWYIEISSEYEQDPFAIGAILAHECCHILVADRGVPRFKTAVDEVHVDLAAMLSGLGALTLNGIQTTAGRHRSFGYVCAPLLHHAFAEVAVALGIDVRRATRFLRRAASRNEIRWQLVMRVRRNRLAYRVLDSHVVVECPGCTTHMRLPTGTIATASCASCHTRREFDGRGCTVTALPVPEPMLAAETPAKPGPLAHLAMAPVGFKLLFVVVVVVFAWAIARQ